MDTTRRHPRTLSEAFRKPPPPEPIQHYRSPSFGAAITRLIRRLLSTKEINQ